MNKGILKFMSAHNFWHNFSHGFMHGMFGSNPFFSCWGGFSPMWGNPFMFGGGFGACFNPFSWNSSVFLTPNTMTGNFYSLMPDLQTPGFDNFEINVNKLFPTENIWDKYNEQMQNRQNIFDTFVKSEKTQTVTEENEQKQTQEKTNTSETQTKEEKSANNTAENTPLAGNKTKKTNSKSHISANTSANENLQNAKLTDEFTGTADQLNKMLNRRDGVLKNKGQVFLDAQKRYGINAAILAAICINESAYGTSNLARNKNNVGGVSQGKGFKTYNSVDECIMDIARFLKSGYVDKGLVTIKQVGKKYCPVDDPRDTKGVNAGWGKAVASITQKIETLA